MAGAEICVFLQLGLSYSGQEHGARIHEMGDYAQTLLLISSEAISIPSQHPSFFIYEMK